MKLKQVMLMTFCFTLMMSGCLASCRGKSNTPETSTKPELSSPDIGGGSETDTEGESEGNNDYVEPTITGPYADTIMLSNRLSNGVQAYYANPMMRFPKYPFVLPANRAITTNIYPISSLRVTFNIASSTL